MAASTKLPEPEVDPDKFGYLFGKVVTGTHNTQRILQNMGMCGNLEVDLAPGNQSLLPALETNRVANSRLSSLGISVWANPQSRRSG